ncbi:aldo/keto reductase [Streptomyces sp. NPDC005480]|uniref:aldo/keto reductase n=1 Tax=Streptomyces sp. NPDC005480 TaxID=3154880 RepID=UPI00339EF3F7
MDGSGRQGAPAGLARPRRRTVADQAGFGMAQLAIAWVLSMPGASAAVIGAARPEQSTENAQAPGARLGEDVLRVVDEVLDGLIDRGPAKTARMMTVETDWQG